MCFLHRRGPPSQVTQSSAVITIYTIAGATSYWIFCTGVTSSSQYSFAFPSNTVAITISSLTAGTHYT